MRSVREAIANELERGRISDEYYAACMDILDRLTEPPGKEKPRKVEHGNIGAQVQQKCSEGIRI